MEDQLIYNVEALASYYEYFILAVVTIFTLQWSNKYKVANFDYLAVEQRRPDSLGLFLCILFSIMIGTRCLFSLSYHWGDSSMYEHTYQAIEGWWDGWDWHAVNYIWDNLFGFWAGNRLGLTNLFLLSDFIYFGATYAACKKWFPHDTTVAYLAFLGAFSTYSYSFNGVKAGVAAALFLVAIAYYEKKWFSVIFLFLSWGFHHSMQMPIAAYILTLFFKNPKYYFYGWVFCVLMAVFHISFFQNLFGGMAEDSQGYLNVTQETAGEDFGGAGGFRPDFLLYSAVPVWIGWRLVMKEGRKLSREYLTLLYMYLTCNAVWCLCMYASYCNRIAYLSWFMYPFVLLYPFLKEDLTGSPTLFRKTQYDMMTMVFKYHLYFTLFMELIFYKFIRGGGEAAVG